MSRKRSRNTVPATSFVAETPAEPRKNLPAQAGTLIADARNDITIPYFSGRMQYADDTLIERGGGKGLKIYDELERDAWAGAVLDKRKKQLTAREWRVSPPKTGTARDIEAANFVRDVIEELPFDRICEDLLDATLKGFAISEIVWARNGNGIYPARVMSHDQRRFVFDETWQPRLLTWTNMDRGESLPDRKFVVHRFGVKGNNPYGLGLGSRLFWPVMFKRQGVAFWLHFLDKFAGPTVVGKTPFGSLPDMERKLLQSLADARTASAIVVPIGADVEFLEASRSGSVTYQNFLEYWDKQISICVNGETLTTDMGAVGSRAASETHADMLGLLVDGDSDLLSATLRDTLIRWLVEYNVPGARLPFVWRERPADAKAEAETAKAKADAALAANSALESVLVTASRIPDDGMARAYIVSTGLVEDLDAGVIDALVAIRASTAASRALTAAPAAGEALRLPGAVR